MNALIDLTGKKIGKTTVIRRSENDEYGHATWLCECECGNTFVRRGANIRSDDTVGCGCSSDSIIDETGNRHGKLTVVSRFYPADGGESSAYWTCQCDCGNVVQIKGTVLRQKSGLGQDAGCGCRHPLPDGEAAFNALISYLKVSAKKREYEFSLTDDQIYELVTKPCFYCGTEPYQKMRPKHANGLFVYNGLDRVNNRDGYTIDNVVPCCGRCNRMKRALSKEKYREHICLIYHHWASKDC